MLLGHFAVGLLAKPLAPRVPLPVLLLAPQVLDVIWPALVAVGVERARVVPGLLPASPLDLEYMPYSHSLLAAVLWSLLFAAGYRALTRDSRGAVVTGLLVLSHWVLDVVAHRPDMPVGLDGPRIGLGLWRSIPGTLLVEGLLFAAGVFAYARATRPRDRAGVVHWWLFVALLALMFVASVVGPPPPGIEYVLGAAALSGLLLVWGAVIERHRETVAAR
ncbi:hypothetical protein [Nannocystis punicea]|uniref:LexA-binding, inner membrane-associated hydrolase n=1 Tax=Nannocystis punicea TaxID=2995304 RepID=A0ABY7GW80_9BACT|nr:hypothetical protein [Nannocystis poenicansa]WAS91241.1 hypothetical protein O0S08_34060 [Nannocystis poenicansa]